MAAKKTKVTQPDKKAVQKLRVKSAAGMVSPSLSSARTGKGKAVEKKVQKLAAPAGVESLTKAPQFERMDADGKVFSSKVLRGKSYVIYFYPKDDTPGCTKEACGFRDTLAAFAALSTPVIGVSPDSIQSHAKFREKYGLNFTLLADEDRTLAQAFGVWKKKRNYGREYMGIERSTFLVDNTGTIRKAWRGVRVDGHMEQVLTELERLE